jgi:hypothetical protein
MSIIVEEKVINRGFTKYNQTVNIGYIDRYC